MSARTTTTPQDNSNEAADFRSVHQDARLQATAEQQPTPRVPELERLPTNRARELLG